MLSIGIPEILRAFRSGVPRRTVATLFIGWNITLTESSSMVSFLSFSSQGGGVYPYMKKTACLIRMTRLVYVSFGGQ
jgi:hypothetical protein